MKIALMIVGGIYGVLGIATAGAMAHSDMPLGWKILGPFLWPAVWVMLAIAAGDA